MKIFILAVSVIVLACFGFIGLSVVNSKDCSQLVIDTYEIHSGIDIPKVNAINCYYDDDKNVRMSLYEFKGLTYHDQYLNKHKFERVKLSDLKFPIAIADADRPTQPEVYAAKGTTWGNEWRYIVEKETNRLWAEIMYN